jgi:hypothetical protein
MSGSGWDLFIDLIPFIGIALLAAALSFATRWAPTLCLVAFVLAIIGIVAILTRYY